MQWFLLTTLQWKHLLIHILWVLYSCNSFISLTELSAYQAVTYKLRRPNNHYFWLTGKGYMADLFIISYSLHGSSPEILVPHSLLRYKYIFKWTQDLIPTLLLTRANQITCMSLLTGSGPCTWAKATHMNERIQIQTSFLMFYLQTCDYLMLNALLTHFFIAIPFIIYFYKGCYSILLLQELLEFWDCCQWNLGIIWVIHVWIPSLSVSRFT